MTASTGVVTVLMGGDVMLGRGVDQILPHPGEPVLREPYVRNANQYVDLAEKANGPIHRPVDWTWPWGEALASVDDIAPDVRLINLETAITADGAFAPHKAVHYRMHSDNLPALTAFRPDVCALANNHILDFGRRGLSDTLAALTHAGIRPIGAGPDLSAARSPASVLAHDNRVLIESVAATSSGVPESWAAHIDRPGVWLIRDVSHRAAADEVAEAVLAPKRDGDITIVSLHWGSNWGYALGLSEIQFAHRLVDAGVDIVHGHSSHHPRPIEIYRGKPILYGCGDVIDDYEGIGGHESFRAELRLLYVTSTDPSSGELASLQMIPLRVRHMRLERASQADAAWLCDSITHISRRFGTEVITRSDGLLDVLPSNARVST
jgi:poly-gamma-glutamate synthesis protein (capsule biosynthesis protein)